jgi:hypothetical protein
MVDPERARAEIGGRRPDTGRIKVQRGVVYIVQVPVATGTYLCLISAKSRIVVACVSDSASRWKRCCRWSWKVSCISMC